MDPVPLNAVRAAAADGAAGTSGTAVAAPVAETGRVAYSRDVTWHHPEVPWIGVGTVISPTTLSLGTGDLPGGANCARVACSLKELQDDSDGTGGPCGSGGAGADCDGGGPLPKSA